MINTELVVTELALVLNKQLKQIQVEVESLRKDAERWRFWRRQFDMDIPQADTRAIEAAVTPEALDAAVDAAMETRK